MVEQDLGVDRHGLFLKAYGGRTAPSKAVERRNSAAASSAGYPFNAGRPY
jgi:hypothetical protein